MNHIKLLLLLVLTLNFSIVIAQDNIGNDKIIEIGTTDNQTMDHLDVFCNRFGGRPTGSDAYNNAAEWAASKFEQWGLEVEMDEAGELPVGFNRGPWFGKLLSEKGMNLNFVTPSYTAGTKGIQRGHVIIEPKTLAEFNAMKKGLKGAWVLISGENTGWPIDYSIEANHKRDSIKIINNDIEKQNNKIRRDNWSNRGNDYTPEKLLSFNEEPALFYEEMCEAGILGIIQSSRVPMTALYDRKNIDNMTFETLPGLPDIKLDERQYKIIKQMAVERRYFQLEFDIRNHFKMGPVKYHNVIGKIEGSEFPDEYVIMGGHLDSFDAATGGVDNGSGISVTMEAARILAKAEVKPKRTILFVLWAGEEFGLLGSKSWVKRNPDKLDKISNMFNRDWGPTVPLAISATKAMKADLKPICKVINSINPDFPFAFIEKEPVRKPTIAKGTDTKAFSVKGIPTIQLQTGDPKGYNFSYGEIWHTERDLFNKSIAEYQEHASTATAIILYGVSNLDHLLSREGYFIRETDK